MFSQPPKQNEGDDRGRGLVAVTRNPVLPLVEQRGVFSPSAAPQSPSSSSCPPPYASTSSSVTPVNPPFNLSAAAPPSSTSPSPHYPMSLPSSPPSSSSPPHLLSPSSLPSAPPSVSSAPFIPSSPCSSPAAPSFTSPLLPSSVSSSSFPTYSSISANVSVSSPVPPFLHSSLSFSFSPSAPLSVPFTSLPASFYNSSFAPVHLSPFSHHSFHVSHTSASSVSSGSFSSPNSSLCTTYTSSCSPPSSSVHIPPSHISPSAAESVPLFPAQSLAPPPLRSAPHPAPTSCSCSSLLPRLLSAHRLEVRRLLRGAMASLGRRLDSLERRNRRTSSKKRVSRLRRRGRNREDDLAEEEGPGRLPEQLSVSLRDAAGAEEEDSLTVHNLNQRKQSSRGEGGTSQSVEAVCVSNRKMSHSAALQLHSSAPKDDSHLFPSAGRVQTCSQSEDLHLLSSRGSFSGSTPPLFLSSALSAFYIWHHSSDPPSMLRLSVVAIEKLLDSVRGRACASPLRPLKDWTAPPSLTFDHCYVRTPPSSSTSSIFQHQKKRANCSLQNLHLSRRRPPSLSPCSPNEQSAPFPASQSVAGSKFHNGELSKRVSQIRIRRASPRETLLTPMGLPKVKRLKKKEFSLEEIYTNKNYKSPTTNRCLETIFEEPREKNGALLLIGQQRRRRLLLFPDFTQPRKRKRTQGMGLPVATVPRKRTAARRHCHSYGSSGDDPDLDVMLVERLSALEDFLTQQGLDV